MLAEMSKSWDLEGASVENCYKCYSEQIAFLKQNYKSGKINRAGLQERYEEIKEGLKNINTFWQGAQKRINASLAGGESFFNDEIASANSQALSGKLSNSVKSAQSYSASKLNSVKCNVLAKRDLIETARQKVSKELSSLKDL